MRYFRYTDGRIDREDSILKFIEHQINYRNLIYIEEENRLNYWIEKHDLVEVTCIDKKVAEKAASIIENGGGILEVKEVEEITNKLKGY